MTDRRHTAADEETLSAYLDGALPPDERARVAAELDTDPALRRRLEAFRAADAAVRRAYAPVLDEPLPDRVLELLRRDGADGAGNGGVVELRSRPRPPRFFMPASIAAGVAFVAGFLAAYAVLTEPDAPASEDSMWAGGVVVEAGTDLHGVLESGLSAETANLAGGRTATARLTFLNAAGEYCRQIDVAGERGTARAIACRRDGRWRVALASFAAAPSTGRDDVFRPASSATSAVLDDAIDAMIEGDPLGRSEEREAILRAWEAPARERVP